MYKKWVVILWNCYECADVNSATSVDLGKRDHTIEPDRLETSWLITPASESFSSITSLISAKEVMFSPEFVCLSVCLSVSNITRKVVDRFG